MVNLLYSKVGAVREHIMKLERKLLELGSSIAAKHGPREDNKAADAVFHANVGDAYRFYGWMFEVLQAWVLPCTIDHFATSTNRLVPKYNSFFVEDESYGIDAFAQ